MNHHFCPLGSTFRAVPDTTAVRTALSGGSSVRVVNYHASVNAFIKFGSERVTADANSMIIRAGTEVVLLLPPGTTHVSAYAAAAGTLEYTTGEGGAT